MTKMKETIIVFSSNVDNWGAERSVCSMCDYLHRQGKEVLVILPREGTIINLLNEIHVEYVVLPFRMWIYTSKRALRPDVFIRDLWHSINTAKFIEHEIIRRGYKPVLVYSSTILFGTGLYCAKKWNVPHVHHFRENIDAFGYKFIFGNKLTTKYIANHTHQIICTCNAVKERYAADFVGKKMDVVNNGVPAIDNLSVKPAFDKIRLIQVARFMDDKRVIDTLHAVKILVDAGYVHLKLDIYGKGREEDMYKEFISKNHLDKFIEIKGFCQKIPFQEYHVGLMTSTFEAFARTTLDYMNNGLAVVASNTGGNLEQVVDGKTGLLFKVHNAKNLAECLKYLCDNPNKIVEFGKNGRQRFLNNFTQDMYQRKIGKIILSYLN